MNKEVELKMLEPHKAEGIKELCFREIAKQDNKFVFMGYPNCTLGERREDLLKIRKEADNEMTRLEKEADELMHAEPVINPITKQPVDNKAIILARLHNIMDIVQIIDKYNINDVKEVLKKTNNPMAHNLAHARLNFPLTFEGDDMVVSCEYYEDFSLNDKLFAEFCEIEDTDTAVEFLKKHVELGTITLLSGEDVKELQEYKPVEGVMPPVVNPLFANLDNLYVIEDNGNTTEVDK